MGRFFRTRSQRPDPAAQARAQALRAAEIEAAALREAADGAAAEKAAAQARWADRMRVFAVCAQVWLLVVGVVTAVAPPAPTWLRVLGIIGALLALSQLVAALSSSWPAGSRRPAGAQRLAGARGLAGPQRLAGARGLTGRRRSRGHQASAPDVSLLGARNPELDARVKDALVLLDGPVGQLVDADVVQSTQAAFTAGLDRVDQLYQEEIDLRSTLATLGDDLHAAGRKAGDDEQYQSQRADLARLRAQREKADEDLSAAAATLTKSVTDAAFGQHRRAAGAQLSVQRRRALSSDSAPDLVLARGLGALTELTDAVDGVRARLDAIRELDAITDRFAPDEAEAEVDR